MSQRTSARLQLREANDESRSFHLLVSCLKDSLTKASSGISESACKVLFITGAGISTASGIPTYRTGQDAVWSKIVTSWGTRAAFLNDPVEWWRIFYDRNVLEFTKKEPNEAHKSLARLSEHFSSVGLITQNVDGLHTGVPQPQRIEVHGRTSLFKCVTPGCRYSFEESISPQPGCEYETGPPSTISEVPRCPQCKEPAPPQFLMFDELYESHSYYQWQKALKWVEEAQLYVFVGTSMAVGVTEEVLRTARRKKRRIFNINLDKVKKLEEYTASCKADGDVGRILNIIGEAVEVLPSVVGATMLADYSDELASYKARSPKRPKTKRLPEDRPSLLQRLSKTQYGRALRVIRLHAKDNLTSPLGVIEGKTKGRVFVDNINSPTVVVIAAAGRFWTLCGTPEEQILTLVINTLKRYRDWNFMYSHPNGWWVHRLRDKLHNTGGYFEFARTLFSAPSAIPTEIPEIPVGYKAKKIDCPQDFDKYSRVWPWIKSVWRSFKMYSQSGGIGYIALDCNGNVVGGCVSAYTGSGTIEPDLYVTPGHERKGLATYLSHRVVVDAMERSPTHFTKSGGASVAWTCDEDNFRSKKIAAKLGFKEVGRTILFSASN